ncbi:hypothetical protein BC832DRAFT_527617 [Gaertneriomyces semiglobifer]|nr:hypothetical protein BC832DRAFT_527617 [Gaertneriomyces semiglobifer]
MTTITGSTTYFQKLITLPSKPRGCHLITSDILSQLPDLKSFRLGMANFFLQHTSAALTINENCDPDVRKDMEMMLNRLAPEDAPYKHTDEGSDDMPGHVKSSLFGVSLDIPVREGGLGLGYVLGTWQGIWLCEARNRGGSRKCLVTIHGIKA